MLCVLNVNNKSQSSSEICKNTKYSGQDEILENINRNKNKHGTTIILLYM